MSIKNAPVLSTDKKDVPISIGKMPVKTYGTRIEVYEGEAKMTRGGLTKDMLVYDDKRGTYKSKKAIERGRQLVDKIRESAKSLAAEPLTEPLEAEKPTK